MHRAGKKIDGNYALVTMLGEMNKIRIVVRAAVGRGGGVVVVDHCPVTPLTCFPVAW